MYEQHVGGQSHDVVQDKNSIHASQECGGSGMIAADVNRTKSMI